MPEREIDIRKEQKGIIKGEKKGEIKVGVDKDKIDEFLAESSNEIGSLIEVIKDSVEDPVVQHILAQSMELSAELLELEEDRENAYKETVEEAGGALSGDVINNIVANEIEQISEKMMKINKKLEQFAVFGKLYQQFHKKAEPNKQIVQDKTGQYVLVDRNTGEVKPLEIQGAVPGGTQRPRNPNSTRQHRRIYNN